MDELTYAITPAMVAFVFATTAAPGPNAALMLAVGARLGLRAGLPVLFGLAAANALAKGAIAASVRWLAGLDPLVIEVGTWVAVGLTLWLAWRLVRRMGGLGTGARVAGFWDAFAFQLANPKVAITGLAAATLFCVGRVDEVGHAVSFGAVAFPSVLVGAGAWLLIGWAGGRWLQGPRAVRAMNVAVGALLVGAMVPVLLG